VKKPKVCFPIFLDGIYSKSIGHRLMCMTAPSMELAKCPTILVIQVLDHNRVGSVKSPFLEDYTYRYITFLKCDKTVSE